MSSSFRRRERECRRPRRNILRVRIRTPRGVRGRKADLRLERTSGQRRLMSSVKKIQWLRRLLRHVLVLVGLALLGAFLAATLARYSPRYGVDERELDPRLSPTSA